MIPFASMSNETSICGMPRGAGGMPTSWNLPSVLLNPAISDSPCSTCTSTDGWLSSAVVNVSDFFVGMVVFRSISRVKTPPFVSMPSDSGVTSSRRMSFTSPLSTPPWIAAPTATTSSGLTPLCGSLPISSLTLSTTAGMRVMPPTSTTWSIFDLSMPASLTHCSVGPTVRASRSARELVELRARELQVEVLRPVLRRGDERQVDLRRHGGRQLDLRLLRRLVETLERHPVRREVDALVLLELARPSSRRSPCRSCRRRGGCRRSSPSPRRRLRRARGSTRRTCRRRGRRRGSSGRSLPCRARTRALPRSAR